MYKRQGRRRAVVDAVEQHDEERAKAQHREPRQVGQRRGVCLLYTSDAADERSSVDFGGRRIIKKKKLVYQP